MHAIFADASLVFCTQHQHRQDRPPVQIEPRKKLCPQPVANYDRNRCAARVWAKGRGLQCSRGHMENCSYCYQHQRDIGLHHHLPHGRIDEPVPEAKRQDFMDADGVSSDSCDSMYVSSSSEAESWAAWPLGRHRKSSAKRQQKAESEATVQHLGQHRKSSSLSVARDSARQLQQTSVDGVAIRSCSAHRVPDTSWAQIFLLLEQTSIFRSELVCIFWKHTIRQSYVFDTLDCRSIGIWVTPRGRRTSLTAEMGSAALAKFVMQKRFSAVTKLDIRGTNLAREKWDRSELFERFAHCCPRVRHLLVDGNGGVWSDLGRYMPIPFARSLLRWWPHIMEEEMIVQGYGRKYAISGSPGGPVVRVV